MQRRVILAVSALMAFAAIAAVGASPAAVRDISSTLDGIKNGHTRQTDHMVWTLVLDPGDSDTVYVGTGRPGGVFASTDGGATWRASSDGLPDTEVYKLVIDPQSPATLYAATSVGVFKSTDGGRRWRATGLTKGTSNLLLDPRRPKTVYAATNYGLFKSRDGGERWKAILLVSKRGLSGVYALALNPRRSTTVYAGAGRGVFKSIDAGLTWSAMNRGLFGQETAEEVEHRLVEGFVYAFAVNPRRPQTLYLGCDYGVFKSTNGARSWNAVTRRGLPGHNKYRGIFSLTLDPRNPQTLYAGSRGVFKSNDGGRSWTSSLRLQEGAAVALALDPTDSRTIYTVAGPSKVFKSTDAGQTWRELSLPGF